jgi:hypothetical protein
LLLFGERQVAILVGKYIADSGIAQKEREIEMLKEEMRLLKEVENT